MPLKKKAQTNLKRQQQHIVVVKKIHQIFIFINDLEKTLDQR